MKFVFAICLFLSAFMLAGCDGNGNVAVEHMTITASEAKLMMTDDVVILDVRNQDEFEQGHIPNAILLPAGELRENAERILPDKNQVILVYCRSGVRSAAAAQELALFGYTRVYDFGGIIDWHGEVVVD
ncbi:MAG: rhodanese-like domain-containing protein [Oscillospiraceae bacterium]|nr:rhodanese-like domain-containing protein [Oscillospiraceae bacterium]MCL2250229.1 rhodanese-like domain-containing protein [Oscillospiraceae bacterium]